MTLPSDTITFNDVNLELGRSATATLDLNNSGPRTLAEISSGAISMDNLRGRTSVGLTGASISSSSTTTGTTSYAYAGVELRNNGGIYAYRYTNADGFTYTYESNWATRPATLVASTIQVYASYSGNLCYGNAAFNTWHSANQSSIYWYVDNGNGSPGTTQSRSATITLTLRRNGSTTNLTSANYTVSSTTTYNLAKPPAVEMLMAAGGGAAGWGAAGVAGAGAGAGGLVYASFNISHNTQYNVSIGGGGGTNGASGSNSTAFGYTAIGGGGGAGVGSTAQSGGSGGGGAGNNGASGTSGQGNSGGNGTGIYGSTPSDGGGGGSFVGAGSAATGNGVTAVSGGAGYNESWTGSTISWCPGGNGGGYSTAVNGSNGAANTGGGGNGSGGSPSSGYTYGGSGGSGRMQVRYSTQYAPASAYSGCTYSIVGAYRVYDFTGSGYITW
jgi:hypothetical protein